MRRSSHGASSVHGRLRGRLLGVEQSKALEARAGVVRVVHDHARGDRSTRQSLSVCLARLEWIVGRGIAMNKTVVWMKRGSDR